jgi:hypothetical protein
MKFTRNGDEILLKWGIGDEIHKKWGSVGTPKIFLWESPILVF